MPGWKSRPRTAATRTALTSVARERIHRLVLRTLRNSYGAEAALRTAVQVGATEMLDVGATREAIRDAIANCVVQHPSALPDKRSLVTGQSRTSLLLGRMLGWTETVSPATPHLTP